MKNTNNGNKEQDKILRKLSAYIQLLNEAQELAQVGSLGMECANK